MFKNLTYIEFQVLLQVSALAPALEFKFLLPLVKEISKGLSMKCLSTKVDFWLKNTHIQDKSWYDVLSGADYEDLKGYISDLSRV